MKNRDKILKTIIFIESNLKNDITISDIAREGCCSLYHYIRLFKNMTGLSPKKYLLKRRLTESINELRNSDSKVSAIAYDYVFGSHEVYTRSFKKHFGISPSKVSQGEVIAHHLLLHQISKDYIFQSKETRNQPPELVELSEMTLVGSSYFIKGKLEGLDLTAEWNEFMRNVDLIKNKTNPNECYQMQYWSESQGIEGMHFFIGVEVNALKDVPPQFVVKFIPQGHYLKFVHQGLSKNVGFTYRYIYEEFLPDSEYDLTMPFNFELYNQDYVSPKSEASKSYLFIPIKK